MGDARLRDLERGWRATGSVDDEAAYLLERVRVGDLTRDRLELAAWCGRAGAQRAVGSGALALGGPPPAVAGRVERVLLLITLAQALTAARGQAEVGPAARALEAADAWCRCPCHEHALRAHDATMRLSLGPVARGRRDAAAARAAMQAYLALAGVTSDGEYDGPLPVDDDPVQTALEAIRRENVGSTLERLARDSLAPWLLRPATDRPAGPGSTPEAPG